MPVKAYVGKREYSGTNKNHAEEVLFASKKHDVGPLTVELDAWPCVGEHGHNCHQLFKSKSIGRTITVNITGDHAGYAVMHNKKFGDTGTITYANGVATYT